MPSRAPGPNGMLYFVVEAVYAFCHVFHKFSALYISGNIAIQIISGIAFY